MPVNDLRPERTLVNLRLGIEKAGESGGAAEEKHQESCREGVERSQMSNAPLAVNPPYVLDDVVRRHPGGLVYEQQSLDW